MSVEARTTDTGGNHEGSALPLRPLIAPAHARRMRRNASRSGRRRRDRPQPRPDHVLVRIAFEGGFAPSNGRTPTSRSSRSTATAHSSFPAPRSRSTRRPRSPRSPAARSMSRASRRSSRKRSTRCEDDPRRSERPRVHEHRRRVHDRDHRVRRRCGPDDPRLRARRAARTSRRDAGARVPGPPRARRSSSPSWDRSSTGSPRARSAPRPPTKRPLPACSSGSTARSTTSPRSRSHGRSTRAWPASESRHRSGPRIGAGSSRARTGTPSIEAASRRTSSPLGRMPERAVLDPVPAPPSGRERLLARGSTLPHSGPEPRGQVPAGAPPMLP